MARAPSGFLRPPGMPPAHGPLVFGSRLIIEAVGVQRGHLDLWAILAWPFHSMPSRPTPMP